MRRVSRADRRLYALLHRRVRHSWFDGAMIAVTTSGTKGTVWIAACAAMFAVGDGRVRLYAVLSVASLLLAEGTINLVLKPTFRRQRPYERTRLAALLVKPPGPHSLPSAHAGSSLAAAIPLVVGLWPWGLVFLFLALLIGYSRVYVGVHYPTDVAAGFLVGVVAAALILALAAVLRLHRL
jgi:undecaprenyl-diphosphatase